MGAKKLLIHPKIAKPSKAHQRAHRLSWMNAICSKIIVQTFEVLHTQKIWCWKSLFKILFSLKKIHWEKNFWWWQVDFTIWQKSSFSLQYGSQTLVYTFETFHCAFLANDIKEFTLLCWCTLIYERVLQHQVSSTAHT